MCGKKRALPMRGLTAVDFRDLGFVGIVSLRSWIQATASHITVQRDPAAITFTFLTGLRVSEYQTQAQREERDLAFWGIGCSGACRWMIPGPVVPHATHLRNKAGISLLLRFLLLPLLPLFARIESGRVSPSACYMSSCCVHAFACHQLGGTVVSTLFLTFFPHRPISNCAASLTFPPNHNLKHHLAIAQTPLLSRSPILLAHFGRRPALHRHGHLTLPCPA